MALSNQQWMDAMVESTPLPGEGHIGEVALVTVPDPLCRSILFIWEAIFEYLDNKVSDELKPLQITKRHYYILRLLTTQGPQNQQDLSDMIRVNRNAMVHLIDHLERHKLAHRRQNQHNRREYLVTVTDKGKSTERRATEMLETLQNEIGRVAALKEPVHERLVPALCDVANRLGPVQSVE